jgi:hypothetical protein
MVREFKGTIFLSWKKLKKNDLTIICNLVKKNFYNFMIINQVCTFLDLWTYEHFIIRCFA